MTRKLHKRNQLIELVVEYNPDAMISRSELAVDIGAVFVAKRMITKYLKNGVINEKLLINQIIQVKNVFGVNGVNLLFYITHTDREFAFIKSILIFLGAYNERYGADIQPDQFMRNKLSDTAKEYNLSVPQKQTA